jgi:hypothetical protein
MELGRLGLVGGERLLLWPEGIDAIATDLTDHRSREVVMKRVTLGFPVCAAFLAGAASLALAGQLYLSDLPFTVDGLKGVANQGYFDAIRVNSHNTVRTMAGTFPTDIWSGPMKLSGTTYDKGLTFHMVHDETMKATWLLAARYSRLTATVGLDDNQDVPGTYPDVTVTFLGDGKALDKVNFLSVYGKTNPTPSVDVPLNGVKSLTIAVTMSGASSTDLDIINPELEVASPKP